MSKSKIAAWVAIILATPFAVAIGAFLTGLAVYSAKMVWTDILR